MIDCSEVIPVPAALRTKPHFPAGKTIRDVEPAVRVYCLIDDNSTNFITQCAETPFPTVPTDRGFPTVVARVYVFFSISSDVDAEPDSTSPIAPRALSAALTASKWFMQVDIRSGLSPPRLYERVCLLPRLYAVYQCVPNVCCIAGTAILPALYCAAE